MTLALDPRPSPLLALAPGLGLARGRTHEATGPSRRLFALLTAAAVGDGPVLWLHPRWWPERLMGDGVRPLIDPGRLVIGRCRGALDILWCAEETLRSGAVPLVVAELPAPPALTPVRRLHLAAEAGAAAAGTPPLCLLLTPEAGGAAGVESRWHLAPLPGWAVDGRARWRLARTRARALPEAVWEMRLDGIRPVLTAQPPAPARPSRAASGCPNKKAAPGWPGAASTPTGVAATGR